MNSPDNYPINASEKNRGNGDFRGRRSGRRLSDLQKGQLKKTLEVFGIQLKKFDLEELFPKKFWPLRLEIGSGFGEHLIHQATRFPDTGFIACEPYINGAAALSKLIEATNVRNIRLFVDDARLLLDLMPDNILNTVYLLFPDPWPKKRHKKRRFVQPNNLDQLARLLVSGGSLWFATDHYEYCRWTLSHFRNHPEFDWLARGPEDWRIRPEGWLATRYELKAVTSGFSPIFLHFRRY